MVCGRHQPRSAAACDNDAFRAEPCPALAALLLAVSALPGLAFAQTSHVAEIAAYRRADREQRLIEVPSGRRNSPSTAPCSTDDITVLVAAFDKKYGVKVKVWRADSEGFLQRIVGEARPAAARSISWRARPRRRCCLYRENLLQEVKSPNLADIIPEAIAPHRQWTAIYLNTIVRIPQYQPHPQGRPACSPTTSSGRNGRRARDRGGGFRLVRASGHGDGRSPRLERGGGAAALSRDRQRERHFRAQGAQPAHQPGRRRRVPLALTVYGFLAEQAKLKGAPLDWFVLPPAVARATAQGLARNAPHPNAAVLFFDFLLGEGQQILASRQFVTVSRKIDTPFDRSQFKIIDSASARPGPQVAGHLSAHDHRPVAVMVTAGNKSSHADRVIALLAPISPLHSTPSAGPAAA